MKKENTGRRDKIYIAKLIRSLTSLTTLLIKQPDSDFSQAEMQAMAKFLKSTTTTGCLRSVIELKTLTNIIPTLHAKDRVYAISYVQVLLFQAMRLSALLKETHYFQLRSIERELKRNDLSTIDRFVLKPSKNLHFHSVIYNFLHAAESFKYVKSEISESASWYATVLTYYFAFQKEIKSSREWYEFLLISNYLLFGAEFGLKELQSLVKNNSSVGEHHFLR